MKNSGMRGGILSNGNEGQNFPQERKSMSRVWEGRIRRGQTGKSLDAGTRESGPFRRERGGTEAVRAAGP